MTSFGSIRRCFLLTGLLSGLLNGLTLVFCLALLVPTCRAQSGRSKTVPTNLTAADSRAAQALYEEANNYVTNKYEEFNRRSISFDPRLEAATRQEQKELAARYAATLAAQTATAGDDLYYLGLLYHLADNSDGALGALRQFVASCATGELAQTARSAIVVHALKKNLLPEAESTLAQYAQQQPQSQQERYGMETLAADAFYKQRRLRADGSACRRDAQSGEAFGRRENRTSQTRPDVIQEHCVSLRGLSQTWEESIGCECRRRSAQVCRLTAIRKSLQDGYRPSVGY